MDDQTEQQRRWDVEQTLASARIEGHEPPPEFLADCERYIRGELTTEQMRAASLAQAIALDRAAAARGPVPDAA